MVEPRCFIFLGSDELQKQKKIETLQKKIFPPSLKDLNYTVLYGDDKQLGPKALKEILFSLPTQGAKKRMVLIRMAHKLSRANRTFLLREAAACRDNAIVVLDCLQAKGSQAIVGEFTKIGAELHRFKDDIPANVFDLCRAITRRKPETALVILASLLGFRERSGNILGAIFWQWERSWSQRRLSENSYKKGLKLLLEADKRLKSSASIYARQNLILEALVVKLTYLA